MEILKINNIIENEKYRLTVDAPFSILLVVYHIACKYARGYVGVISKSLCQI